MNKKICLPPFLYFFFITSFIIINSTAQAQQAPFIQDSLYSKLLQEQRAIRIILPPGYNTLSKENYTTLYVLDGEWNTTMASHIQQYVHEAGFMPNAIIIGIPNTYLKTMNLRIRDLTVTNVPEAPKSGGASKFLAFISRELMPYIQNKFPAKGSKILFGSSLGGAFCFYTFLTDPTAFDAFIASDPSLWWDHAYLTNLIQQKGDSISGKNKAIYVGGRQGSAYHSMGISAMDSTLQHKSPSDLHWKFTAYADETHPSVSFKTLYDGLKFVHYGNNSKSSRFHPMNGTVLPGKPFKLFFNGDTSVMRYTLDGSVPDFNSPKLPAMLDLSGPDTLLIKSFAFQPSYDTLMRGIFKADKAFIPSELPKHYHPEGFYFSMYHGLWDTLPDFKKMKPLQKGITGSSIDMANFPEKPGIALLLEGYLKVEKEGYYIFAIRSDGSTKLLVAGAQLIDAKYKSEINPFASYIVYLPEGFYPLRVEYLQNDIHPILQLLWVPPGKLDPMPIPQEALFYKN